MEQEDMEKIIECAWDVFSDLPQETKLELQKRKRKFINRAQWKALEIEKKEREQYM